MSDGTLFRDLMAHYDPDKQPIQEFKIIHRLVKDPNNASPDDAVKQILGLTNYHLAANRNTWPVNTMKGEFPWSVISLVMEIAAYTPFARQGKLLEFILRLQKNTVKDPRTTQGVKYNGEERVWDELPMLEVYVSDFWLFSHDKPQPPSKIQEWENKTSFLAQISASSPVSYAPSVTSVHPMDYSHYGLYACREAFEEPHDSSSDGGEGARSIDFNGSGRQYETQVRTACIWFIHAGERLYQNCEHSRALQLFEGPPTRGFDQLRWSLWNEGLVSAQNTWKNPSTQDLIRRALAEVNRVED